MAGTFGGGDDEVISGINITPLVDVVLVLLIIFLITAPAIYQSAIKVQLPKAASAEAAERTPLEFSLTAAGELRWGKEAVTWESLPRALAERGAALNLRDATAVISADEATPHGTVIRLMDLLRQAGLSRFALSTEPTAAPPR